MNLKKVLLTLTAVGLFLGSAVSAHAATLLNDTYTGTDNTALHDYNSLYTVDTGTGFILNNQGITNGAWIHYPLAGGTYTDWTMDYDFTSCSTWVTSIMGQNGHNVGFTYDQGAIWASGYDGGSVHEGNHYSTGTLTGVHTVRQEFDNSTLNIYVDGTLRSTLSGINWIDTHASTAWACYTAGNQAFDNAVILDAVAGGSSSSSSVGGGGSSSSVSTGDVFGAVTTGLTSFKDDGINMMNGVVPIALGLVISISLVYFMIRTFRKITHI